MRLLTYTRQRRKLWRYYLHLRPRNRLNYSLTENPVLWTVFADTFTKSYNLCDNAIRYNKEGGKVTIDLEQKNNNTILSVADTGIGIPTEHQSRIFERFYRVDKSHSKETGGTGLGLSIVKHAVAYHGGKIKLESTVNVGTTITVCFDN